MKKILKVFLIVFITFLVIWIGTLLRCEYLTQKYYDDFEYAYTANTMLGDMEYFKVLSCNGKYAEVYYVSKNYTIADVLTFKKIQGEWVYNSWKSTVWTTLGGSASEVIWPYWWHFIYGGI